MISRFAKGSSSGATRFRGSRKASLLERQGFAVRERLATRFRGSRKASLLERQGFAVRERLLFWSDKVSRLAKGSLSGATRFRGSRKVLLLERRGFAARERFSFWSDEVSRPAKGFSSGAKRKNRFIYKANIKRNKYYEYGNAHTRQGEGVPQD